MTKGGDLGNLAWFVVVIAALLLLFANRKLRGKS